MRNVRASHRLPSPTTPWLVPVLAALLGCSSGSENKNDDGESAGSGRETYLLKMESTLGVLTDPPVPTTFTLAKSSYVTRVWTYHYGATIGGKSPTIAFKNTTTGAVHGPWPQTGYKSINGGLDASRNDPGHIPGPPDNYWMAYPAAVIPAGTYQVIDSDPATWAYTSDLGNRGVTWIYGWAGGPPAVDAGVDAPNESTISVSYAKGELAGQTALHDQLTPLFDKTAAALVQAVFTVNSFLFTDPAVTSFAAFQARKAEADQALDVLAKYAGATESLLAAYWPDEGDGGVKDGDAGASDAGALQPVRLKALTPEEVLATLSSGPSTAPIKTLMKAYNVNAKKAQLILNTAMAGLDSQAWSDFAQTSDHLMRQATLVKESAKLGFTIVGTAVTAGGVSGALGVAQAGKAIIAGTKGAIAVSKAGAELVMGKDLPIKEGSKESLVMTTVSTVSDIIAIGNFQKILDGTATAKDALKGLATITSKVNNAFENKTITFGELKVTIKDGLSIGSSIDVGYINGLLGGPANPPSTLPGTYKIYGIPNVVTNMPQDIIDAISKFLPNADMVKSVLVLIPGNSPDAGRRDDAIVPRDSATADAGARIPDSGQTTGSCRFVANLPMAITLTMATNACKKSGDMSFCLTPQANGTIDKSEDPGCSEFVDNYEVSGTYGCNNLNLTYSFTDTATDTYPGCSTGALVTRVSTYQGSVGLVSSGSTSSAFTVSSTPGAFTNKYSSATCTVNFPTCSSTDLQVTAAR